MLKKILNGVSSIGEGLSTFQILPLNNKRRKHIEEINMLDTTKENSYIKYRKTLKDDWENVGNDMKKSFNKFDNKF